MVVIFFERPDRARSKEAGEESSVYCARTVARSVQVLKSRGMAERIKSRAYLPRPKGHHGGLLFKEVKGQESLEVGIVPKVGSGEGKGKRDRVGKGVEKRGVRKLLNETRG